MIGQRHTRFRSPTVNWSVAASLIGRCFEVRSRPVVVTDGALVKSIDKTHFGCRASHVRVCVCASVRGCVSHDLQPDFTLLLIGVFLYQDLTQLFTLPLDQFVSV